MASSWPLRAVVAAAAQHCHRGRLLRAAEQGDDDKRSPHFFLISTNMVSDIGSGNIAKVIGKSGEKLWR
jgi:hypothetical protein